MSMIRKNHNHKLQTNPWHRQEEPHNTRHQEDKQSKATSSLLTNKMIARLEWTQSNAQQNKEQLQNLTMGVTINNKSTTTEPPPWNEQQPKSLWGLMHFTGTKSSPYILLMLKHKNGKLAWRIPNYGNVSS